MEHLFGIKINIMKVIGKEWCEYQRSMDKWKIGQHKKK